MSLYNVVRYIYKNIDLYQYKSHCYNSLVVYITCIAISFTYSYSTVCIIIHAGNETPTMNELNKHLTKYCELWRSIGYKLGLEDDVLCVIRSNCPMQTVECFREVLQKWLKQDVRPTWSTLELAITNAQRDVLSLENLLESKTCSYCHVIM